MKKKGTKYICIEGLEGVGKTTQISLLEDKLISGGYSVLTTKEPGTHHLPLTMELRRYMLSNEFKDTLNDTGRELIAQAIRSIHLEKLIYPSFGKYDFIIQDRGLISSLSYAEAVGHEKNFLDCFTRKVVGDKLKSLYDLVIFLEGDLEEGLNRAKTSKNEFKGGDFIESQGSSYLQKVKKNFKRNLQRVNSQKITVDFEDGGLSRTHEEILSLITNLMELPKVA